MSAQTIASLALFGGTFDPVHGAHLQVARAAIACMAVERVILIPSAQSPLKAHAPLASDADRLAMLQLATAHAEALAVSDYEIEQGGTSYSLKTALHFQQQYPKAALYWILGADQFAQLARWHAIDQLLQVVRFLVCRRRAMCYNHRHCRGCAIRSWSWKRGIAAQVKFANAVVGGSRLLN